MHTMKNNKFLAIIFSLLISSAALANEKSVEDFDKFIKAQTQNLFDSATANLELAKTYFRVNDMEQGCHYLGSANAQLSIVIQEWSDPAYTRFADEIYKLYRKSCF